MATCGTVDLVIENEIFVTDKRPPIAGALADSASGWLWDRTMYSHPRVVGSGWWDRLGGETLNILEGTAIEDWKSGLVHGVRFHHVAIDLVEDEWTWLPHYTTGRFAIHWDDRPLFSDWSVMQLPDPTNVDGDGLVYVELEDDFLHPSIDVRMYCRDEYARIMTYRTWNDVAQYTGVLNIGDESRTIVTDPIVVNDISSRHYEYVVNYDDKTLTFNMPPIKTIGAPSASDADCIATLWWSAGLGRAEGRFIFLPFFPVLPGSVSVATINSGVVTNWTEQDHLYTSEQTDNHYSLNAELGVIQMGGFQAPDLILASNISDTADTIPVLLDLEAFASYSDTGVLVIGSEKIYYEGKGRSSFLNCVRGYNATVAAAHTQYDVVSDIQHGAGTEDQIYVMWTAVPRIEYETTAHDIRRANASSWVNLHPLEHPKSNNVVQIASVTKNVASIELTISSGSGSAAAVAPSSLYYGTDAARLTATAYDALGRRVDDVELTISLESGPGGLNGGGPTYTATTNSRGEITCLYHAPFDQEEVEYPVTSTTHIGPDTMLSVPDMIDDVNPNDVWIYQIVKHDPISGTVGKQVFPYARDATPSFGAQSITCAMAETEDYDNGVLYVLGTDAVKRTYTILKAVHVPDVGDGRTGRKFYVEEATDPVLGLTATAWLIEREAVEWSSGTLNGSRVVLYQWYTSGEYTHPLTHAAASLAAPVAAPLRATSVGTNTVTYANVNLPIPAPTDDSSNLGGYVLIAPRKAVFEASGVDPYSGTLVTSNTVQVNLRLPNQLVGVGANGESPIPWGWTFPTESFNIGAGLGGANFVTINPVASGINRFTFSGTDTP